MSIRKRLVKNKRLSNGLRSGKEGTVYDVFIKFKQDNVYRSYCKRGFLTMSEAAKHERSMKVELIKRSQKLDGYQRLDDYLMQWLADGQAVDRWSLNTLMGYQNNVRKYILPVCGQYSLNHLSPGICDQILLRMKFQGLSDSSLRYVRQTLKAALNDTCSYGYLTSNPADFTRIRFNPSDYTPELYDLKKMAYLMNHAYGNAWECVLLLTGLYGLRRSEALGLKWSHIDFYEREIQIVEQLSSRLIRQKTGKISSKLKTRNSKRTLYLSDYAMSILLRQLQRPKNTKDKSDNQNLFHDQDYVLFRHDGLPLDERSLAKQFHLFTDQINLPRCRIHDLRHSAASNIYALTGDYLVVARILGHTIKGLNKALGDSRVYESTTSLYIHIHPDQHKAVIKAYHEAIEQEQTQLNMRPKIISGYDFKR